MFPKYLPSPREQLDIMWTIIVIVVSNSQFKNPKPHLSNRETGFINIQIIAPSLFELRALLMILNHYHKVTFIVKVKDGESNLNFESHPQVSLTFAGTSSYMSLTSSD